MVETGWVVRIVGAADGTPTPHDGRYLVSWDPHSKYGILVADSSDDITQAQLFESNIAPFADWNTISNVEQVRPDGKPNKPLSALTIEVFPIERARREEAAQEQTTVN